MESSVLPDDHDADDYRNLLEELELKKQELHSAHQSIEILKRNVQHLEEENSDIKHELDESIKKLRGVKNVEHSKFDEVNKQKISDLEHCIEISQASERAAKEEVANLEKKLKHVLDTATSSCAPPSPGQDEEIIHELQSKLSQLEEEKASLKERLVEAAFEHQKISNDLNTLRQELKEKEDEIECLESQFTSQCSINEHLREENLELRAKLETDELQVSTNKKGNSLFSEVDDRRVMAETKIVKMESFLKKVEVQLTKEQKENKRLKQQILLLRQTSGNNYTEDSVKSLMVELSQSKKQIIQLTEALQKQEAAQHQAASGFSMLSLDNVTDTDKHYIKYLQDIIRDKEKQLSLKVQEAQRSESQMRRRELSLAESKYECLMLTNERNKLKSLNAHLNISLQDMQRKYEPEPSPPALQEKVKIVQDEPEVIISSAKTVRNRNALIQKINGSAKCSADGGDKENSSVLQSGEGKALVPEKSGPLPDASSLSADKSVRQRVLGQGNPNSEVKCRTVIYQEVEEVEARPECKQQ